MKNEEQDINFCLIQPFCIFVCFVMTVSFLFFFFVILPYFFDGRGRKRLNSMVIWHTITIVVCKLNIIVQHCHIVSSPFDIMNQQDLCVGTDPVTLLLPHSSQIMVLAWLFSIKTNLIYTLRKSLEVELNHIFNMLFKIIF